MKPPKKWKSARVCPACGSRATKLFHLNSNPPYECQVCGARYDSPKNRRDGG